MNSQIFFVGALRRRKTNGIYNTLAEVIYNGNVICSLQNVYSIYIFALNPKRNAVSPTVSSHSLSGFASVSFVIMHVMSVVVFLLFRQRPTRNKKIVFAPPIAIEKR